MVMNSSFRWKLRSDVDQCGYAYWNSRHVYLCCVPRFIILQMFRHLVGMLDLFGHVNSGRLALSEFWTSKNFQRLSRLHNLYFASAFNLGKCNKLILLIYTFKSENKHGITFLTWHPVSMHSWPAYTRLLFLFVVF